MIIIKLLNVLCHYKKEDKEIRILESMVCYNLQKIRVVIISIDKYLI